MTITIKPGKERLESLGVYHDTKEALDKVIAALEDKRVNMARPIKMTDQSQGRATLLFVPENRNVDGPAATLAMQVLPVVSPIRLRLLV